MWKGCARCHDVAGGKHELPRQARERHDLRAVKRLEAREEAKKPLSLRVRRPVKRAHAASVERGRVEQQQLAYLKRRARARERRRSSTNQSTDRQPGRQPAGRASSCDTTSSATAVQERDWPNNSETWPNRPPTPVMRTVGSVTSSLAAAPAAVAVDPAFERGAKPPALPPAPVAVPSLAARTAGPRSATEPERTTNIRVDASPCDRTCACGCRRCNSSDREGRKRGCPQRGGGAFGFTAWCRTT